MSKKTNLSPAIQSGKQNLSLRDFKALYYELNAKPDTEIKIFEESRIIEVGDLIDLNDKVNDKLNTHKLVTSLTFVKVSLSDNKILDFSSWKEFIDTKWDFAAQVTHIEIQWDFYIAMPHYQIPQRHTLKIRFGTDLKPSEYFQIVLNTDSDIDFEKLKAKVVCKVDYINSIISRELINLVSEWYESLPKIIEENKYIVFMNKYERQIVMSIRPLFNIAAILIGLLILKLIILYKLYSSSGSAILDLGASFSVLMTCVYISNYFAAQLHMHVHSHFDKLRLRSMFKITRGDNNKIKEQSKKNNGLLLKISIEIISGLLVNFIFLILHIFTKV
jgi:hypothetical protein